MITLAFLFLFCICILCCFLTQKSTLSDAFFFWCLFRFGTVLFFGASQIPPVLPDGGHHREVVRFVKMLRYPLVSCRYPVFSVNACIYSTLRTFLVSTPWGLPQTPAPHLRRRRGGRLKPNHLTLWRSVGSAPRRPRVKCTASPPLTPLHLRESSKTIEADGAGNLSRLAKQPLAAWPLRVGGDPTLCGKGAGGFPLHPCHVANAGVGSAHGCWQDPWGVAQ